MIKIKTQKNEVISSHTQKPDHAAHAYVHALVRILIRYFPDTLFFTGSFRLQAVMPAVTL
jgi:hypothetical protein